MLKDDKYHFNKSNNKKYITWIEKTEELEGNVNKNVC